MFLCADAQFQREQVHNGIAVESACAWRSAERHTFIAAPTPIDLVSVALGKSISSMLSPVYQCRSVLRRNIVRSEYSSWILLSQQRAYSRAHAVAQRVLYLEALQAVARLCLPSCPAQSRTARVLCEVALTQLFPAPRNTHRYMFFFDAITTRRRLLPLL